MDYPASSIRIMSLSGIPSTRKTPMQRIKTIWETIKNIYTMLVSFPLFLLDMLGFGVMDTVLAWLCPLITVFTYGTVLGVAASVGVALGVGLGVGVNCAETQYYPFPNTTNIPQNATNGTI